MKRIPVVLTITVLLAGLGCIGCKPSKDVVTFYLRSCKTGRLVGPIQLKPGHALPPLGERRYIVADPTPSELEIRKMLLETCGCESHYSDCVVDDVLVLVRHRLKRRLEDKAPPVHIDGVEALVTMDISDEQSVYDVLCDVAAMTKAHVFIEDGAVVLSSKPLKEMAAARPASDSRINKW